MPKKTKKKKVNLGSKARRLLKHSQKQQQQQKSESASIDDFDAKDTKKQHQQSELELEFRTQNPPPKTQKKSFVYDESEDEELKRLRAVHANPNSDDDDDVTMLLTQKWAPVDVDASDAMIGNAEDGFVSLEVLVDVDAREDIAKTSKTSTSKTLMTSKESKNAEEKKKDDKEAETTTSLQQQQQQQSSFTSLKKERMMMMEERCCFDDDDDGVLLSKKDARILKRKARWKAKVEEAKKRKKTMKRTKETQGKSDEEKAEEEKDIADAWVQYDLHPLLLKGVRKLGFTSPTPIQEKVLHPAIKGRMDIVGAAETGSGKTMAFGLPILQRLMQDKEEEKWYEDYPDEEKPGKGKKHLRALIVTPTRELALQVAKMLADVSTYTDIQIAAIVGGMAKQKQERILKKQPEIIVATPGRLWELIRDGEKHLTNLERLTFLTLDEADRMVERGHFKELENVIKSIPEPPETRRIARSAKLTKRKQPMMTMSKKVTMNGGKEKKNEKEQEEEEEEEEEDEEPTTTDNRRIMARDRQTFVFSATLTVPDEVKYKLDRKKPQPSSKKVNRKIQKNGNDDNDDNEDDENAYRMKPPKELASTNTMGNLMKMVPFYGRVKLCDVSCDSAKKRVNENEKTKATTSTTTTTTTTTTTKVASKVHESALECTDDERDALTLYLLSAHAGSPSIVFVNAISSLRRLTALLKLMKVNAVGLHAGMQQRARLKALDRFKSNQATALIATDVAARGLDIKGVELVVHYQVPRQADAYVHRCGRTGRANQSGVSVALVTPKERSRYLAMLAAMGRERGFRLPPFPVAEETVREATKRVQLAKRIDAIVHKNEKKRADKAWKKRTAEAMDLGLDDSDDDSDDDDQDVMRFSDNEDGVEVIEDFEFYGVPPVDKNNCTPTKRKKMKKKKELTQKKLERLAEKRNATKREIALRNELDALLKLPLGATRRSALTSRKFPTREGGTRFEKTKKEHQQTRRGSQNQTTTSALDVVLSSSSTLRRRHQTTTPLLESGPAAGARAGGATGARKIKTTTTQKKTTKSSSSRRY